MQRKLRWMGVWVIAAMACRAEAATQAQLDAARNRGLAWLVTHQVGDGSWNDGGNLTDDTTAMALTAVTRAGILNSYLSSSAATYLSNRPLYSTDAVARSAVALSKLKIDVTPQMAQLLAMRSTIYGTVWGSYAKTSPSVVDTALALEAYYETGTSYPTADATTGLAYLSNSFKADGGLPYTRVDRDSVSHLIPTAHGLRVFAKYYKAGFATDPSINSSVNWLVLNQRSDGGYSEDASATVSSTFDSALAYAALTEARAQNFAGNAALGTAATTAYNKLADYLVAQQAADGSWTGNALVTASVLNAWPLATLADLDKDGIPDAVEVVLGTNPNVADSRYLAKGNGLGVGGNTYATALGTAVIGQSLSKSLTAPSGVTPAAWALQSGSLPPGVSLNTSTGQLTGIPITGGTYNFTYVVTGSDGRQYVVTDQIGITIPTGYASNPTSNDTPTLPEWGLMLLMALFAVALYRSPPDRLRA